METQVAVLPQPQPKENPRDILLRIIQNSRQGDKVDAQTFFQDVWLLDSQGSANIPQVREYLHFLGSKPVIGAELINQLKLHSQEQNPKALEKDIKVAQILGLDQEPTTAKFLNDLKDKYNPTISDDAPENKSRRTFLKTVLALGAAALAGGATSSRLTPSHVESETAQQVSLFEKIIEPFVQEAYKKRQERASQDPEYFTRVDQQLNQNRLNLMLYAYSEEHGYSYEDYYGFPTILSYDTKSGQIGLIHFSRDVRVPELTKDFPDDITNQRVGRIYKAGGFEGMREIIERMTGLAIDYQLVLRDVMVRDALQKFADGSLEIDVAKDHLSGPFRLDRVEYGDEFIPKGRHLMNTTQLMHYISAEDKHPGGKEDERSYRKNQVLEALIKKFKQKVQTNPLILITALNFPREEVDSKNIQVDFDLNLLTRSGQVIQGLMSALIRRLGGAGSLEMNLPQIDPKKQHVFHDSVFGDGGVTRVDHIMDDQTNAWEVKSEIFTKLQGEDLPWWMLIPDGGNPYAKDLINDYWKSVRDLVKLKMTQKE